MTLTRAALESCYLQSLVAQSGIALTVWSDAELEQSIQQMLQARPVGAEVCIFAYGSLIWNPCFQFIDCTPAMLYGWHRDFCLWAPIGRGTPDDPGLVLGLKRGGSCRGLVFRLTASNLMPELLLMWRREMVVGSYIPRWVRVRQGDNLCSAIAFTVDRHHPCYTGSLAPDQMIRTLATARGEIGSSADYLRHTVEGLQKNGICDRRLAQLHCHVQQYAKRLSAA